ncbi:sulfatase [Roseibacillus persicicus]|uniref:Sulfatase n=1 Tax=Roseibacillus persicicus TaxID=454148 RepID=A0A918WL83_9BACT|nr:sulfatase [Roseibacillus persicicus]GHC53218.1 sulfatase [Roseibacillus persicicus]
MKISALFSILLIFLGSGAFLPGEERHPNIVFILADDLGITDINAFASHFTEHAKDELFYETPHLDQLAADGIPFSQSYSNQLCSPTRAAIMSGRFAARVGFTTATPNTRTYFNQALPVPEGASPHDAFGHKDAIKISQAWLNGHTNTALDPRISTLPRVLKTHRSAFLGKWHLGGHGVADLQPSAHGFEEIAFNDAGGSAYFNWRSHWEKKTPPFPSMPGEYRAGKSGSPTGKDYLTDDLSAQACRYLVKQSQEPKDKKPFFLYYCPFAVHTPLQAPRESIAAFEGKSQIGTLGHRNATYAAMVRHLDDSIGAIRQTLQETGLAESTLIIFTSDNGGVEYTNPAATDNQPFKGGKACLNEGGIRVPTIVYWPGRFEGGTWCNEVIDATDFLPTLAELTNNPLPRDLDGRSMVPLLRNPMSKTEPRTLYWHYPYNVIVKNPEYGTPLTPHSAIRKGAHKLIWDWHGRLLLYNIEADPFEQRDLAKEQPELTQKLHSQLKTWLGENVSEQYLPTLNPDFNPQDKELPFPFQDLR